MTDTPTFAALKAYQREHRESYPDGMGLRVHRALSWLDRAEQCEDADARFIFLWVAFNAAYAQDLSALGRVTESERVRGFLDKLVALDTERKLYNIAWARYTGSLRLLLQNKFVFQPFWDSLNGTVEADDWQERFQRFRAAANRALASMNTGQLLAIVFHPLYTLRNQLVHGGATWNGSVNRPQVELGAALLGDFVPVMLDLMMRNPGVIWGEACYPVVEGALAGI